MSRSIYQKSELFRQCLPVLALAIVVNFTACGTTAPAVTPATDGEGDTPDKEVSITDDTGVDSGTPDSDSGPATVDAPDTKTVDVPKEKDSGPPIGCVDDASCKGKVDPKPVCEKATCNADKVCVVDKIADLCCENKDCDDKNALTTDTCELTKGACEYAPVVGACPGQVNLLKLGFEQNSEENFVGKVNPAGTNIKWHLENKRAHNGKTSMYLGNECYNYDSSSIGANQCVSQGQGATIFASLDSPSINVPAGSENKQFILHYWLWVAAEPTFVASGLKAGTGCAACKQGESCLDLSDQKAGMACVKEKDLLTLKVNDKVAWDSIAIGKSTGGWQHHIVNLAGYGNSFKFQWIFDTNNGAKNNYEGVYIDDISLESLCIAEPDKPESAGFQQCDAATPCKPDASTCTPDSCTFYDNLSGKGVCFFDKEPSCCLASPDCNDNNDCTIDQCNIAGGEKGVCSNVPNDKNDQCCTAKGLSGDTFDAGISSWTHFESNSKAVNWHAAATGGVNGSGALYFGNASGTGYADPAVLPKTKGPAETVCSQEVQLSVGTLYNLLQFQVNMATEWSGQDPSKYVNPPGSAKACTIATSAKDCNPGEECYKGKCGYLPKLDELRVYLKVSGFNTDAIWSSDSIKGTTEGKFAAVKVNLDKYAGKKVQVCFAFDAGDPNANSNKGVAIDNFKVDVTCSEIICEDPATDCEEKPCQAAYCTPTKQCAWTAIKDCCANDGACDDGSVCTTDKCDVAAKTCTHTLADPKCCADNPSVSAENFEHAGKLPDGWVATTLKGNAQGGVGKPYNSTITWNASALSSSEGTYSLNFGKDGTYNAGTTVPGAMVRSSTIAVPANGTTVVTFQLKLSTEWNDPTVFKVPPLGLIIDRMRVGFYNPADTNDKTNSVWTWSSYNIGGSTNGKYQSVVVVVPDSLKGKNVKLQFEFDAGTDTNNNFEGAYIDKLLVQTLCTPPVCTDDLKCAPANPDVCKKYFCTFSEPKTFACGEAATPGPTCCVSGNALPSETFEANKFISWTAFPIAGNVKWQIVLHKYLNGGHEAYFGNAAQTNYDDPGKSVAGTLIANNVQLSADVKKSAWLQFDAWIDIEPLFEDFHITVVTAAGKEPIFVKSTPDNKPKDMTAGDFKVKKSYKLDLSKYKGQTIQITFAFDSFDNKGNDKNVGIYLDDIVVSEPCK